MPTSRITLGGSGASRTVTLAPASNKFGYSDVIIRVTDSGGLYKEDTFRLTVESVNDAPQIANIPEQNTTKNRSIEVPVTLIDSDLDDKELSLTIKNSSNPHLIPVNNVSMAGSGNKRILTLTPTFNSEGSSVISIRVEDDDGAFSDGTFAVNVYGVEADSDFIADAPTVDAISVPAPIDSSAKVATIVGEPNVTNDGAAQYTIPLEFIDGKAGLKPNLELTYSSFGGEGNAGLGWGIGQSSIHRCARVLELDGEYKEITFTTDDQLCLNGQRMRLVAGNSLEAGSEYRLDKAPNIQIKQVSQSGVSYFEVRDGNGKSMFYGKNGNTQVINNYYDAVSKWLLTNEVDNHDQSVDYQYEGSQFEERRLNKITYSGHTIEIIYETKALGKELYRAGDKVTDNYRISDIIHRNYLGELIGSYHLGYKQSRFSGRDLLTSIARCNGSINDTCVIETTFEYSDDVKSGFVSTDYAIDLASYTSVSGHSPCKDNDISGSVCGVYTMKIADIDSDGSPELLIATRKDSVAKLLVFETKSDGKLSYNSQLSNLNAEITTLSQAGDYKRKFFHWNIRDDNGDGIYNIEYGPSSTTFYYDWNGDGIDEQSPRASTNVIDIGNHYSYNTSTYSELETKAFYGFYRKSALIDANGDGLIDRLIPYTQFQTVFDFTDGQEKTEYLNEFWLLEINKSSQGMYKGELLEYPDYNEPNADLDSSEPALKGTFGNIKWMQSPGDINGDGYQDYMGHNYQGFITHVNVGLNNLTFSNERKYYGSFIEGQDTQLSGLADINGDGRDDVVFVNGQDVFWRQSFADSNSEPLKLTSLNNWGAFEDNSIYQWQDLDGDNQPELIYYDTKNQKLRVRYDSNTDNIIQDKLVRINSGLGQEYGVSYARLTDSTVYTPDTNAAVLNWGLGSKVRDITSTMAVVQEFTQSTTRTELGSSQYLKTNYKYEGLKSQAGGRGVIGFRKITASKENGLSIEKHFDLAPPYSGEEVKRVTSINGHPKHLRVVSEFEKFSVNTYPNGLVQSEVALPKTILEKNYVSNSSNGEITNTMLAREVTTLYRYQQHANGYMLKQSEQVTQKDVFSTSGQTLVHTVNYEYEDEDEYNWFISRPTKNTSTVIRAGETVTTTTEYRYSDLHGEIEKEIREPHSHNPALYLQNSYYYDSFGNLTHKLACSIHYKDDCDKNTASPNNIESDSLKVFRRTYYVYDSAGRHLRHIENDKFIEQSFENYSKFGSAQELKSYSDGQNISGQVQYQAFDAFGAMYFSGSNTGEQTLITKSTCSMGACPANATYFISMAHADKPHEITYYDTAQNVVRQGVKTLDGTWSFSDFIFDAKGNVLKESAPYLEGDSPRWKENFHTPLNALWRQTTPDGLTTQYSWLNNIVSQHVSGSYSDSHGASVEFDRTRKEYKNGFGEVTKVADTQQNLTSYTYNALGLLHTVTATGNAVSQLKYDILGRKIELNDPDKGIIGFGYNALGEAVFRTSANVTKTHYRDVVGNTIKTLVDNGTASLVYNFEFNNTPLLHSSSHGGATQVFHHDSYGRVESVDFNYDSHSWRKTAHYDAVGRLFRVNDISGGGRGLQYQYQNGHLDRIFEVSTGQAYYRATDMDAFTNVTSGQIQSLIPFSKEFNKHTGHLNNYTVAHGLIMSADFGYDQLGNLRYRVGQHDELGTELTETFQYDSLNRLESVRLKDIQTLSLTYYDNGNIKTKSDVESSQQYLYATKASSCANATGPHALVSVGSLNYCYDERGNQTARFASGVKTRSVTYSIFDKPLRIWSANGESEFSYDANEQKYKRVDIEKGQEVTTYYVDGHEVIFKNGNKTTKRYIEDIAIHTIEHTTGEEKLHLLFKDHLGSASVISDERGNIVERASFDAFGKRRDEKAWQALANPYQTLSNLNALRSITQQGYTGHQQVDHADVVHMGGRIYDPNMGRFMQADPIVQNPKDAQSLNRYSYVYNNPLSYTDPTGYNCAPANGGMMTATVWDCSGGGPSGDNESESQNDQSKPQGKTSTEDLNNENESSKMANSADESGGESIKSQIHNDLIKEGRKLGVNFSGEPGVPAQYGKTEKLDGNIKERIEIVCDNSCQMEANDIGKGHDLANADLGYTLLRMKYQDTQRQTLNILAVEAMAVGGGVILAEAAAISTVTWISSTAYQKAAMAELAGELASVLNGTRLQGLAVTARDLQAAAGYIMQLSRFTKGRPVKGIQPGKPIIRIKNNHQKPKFKAEEY
ncbi:RHS repeat-associated core domain-containing protein [Pseudoalteromonas sp. SSDWG2]|uniref:RHS repeat-associated core domain-containing protein n=1 Tax=Pseudoalteromonas sp. SSDWG2 TaxID=3139391 RepID=UPI003BA9BD3F